MYGVVARMSWRSWMNRSQSALSRLEVHGLVQCVECHETSSTSLIGENLNRNPTVVVMEGKSPAAGLR
jgi:hypothetical protein